MTARYVLILCHSDGRREYFIHDTDDEAFGVGSRITIEGRCWDVVRPHIVWKRRESRVAPNVYDCEPCPE